MFDAAKVTKAGFSAVALFSNNPSKNVLEWLFTVRSMRKVVAMCDNDAAGSNLNKAGDYSFTTKDYKDLGEAPVAYVKEVCKRYEV